MFKAVFFIFISIFSLPAFSQLGFQFDKGINKTKFHFKLINNLIFVPIKVNGIELNFLLDTGVSETILFSLEDKKEVRFFNTEKVILRGLGNETAVEGLKSTNNNLEFSGLKRSDHMLYIVLDPEFNLSSHIGIPVNGIIGYQFFRDNLVEINYRKKRITVYKDNIKVREKIEEKFTKIPMSVEKSKPYLNSKVTLNDKEIPVKLLVDIGNSDAVWLFENRSEFIKVPLKNFDDFLGKGFSGDIYGKRARIQKLQMGEFNFSDLVAAFPDSISTKSVTMVADRMGSVGGEIMKRFNVVFDYQHQQLYLKKNSNYSAAFGYNRSGVDIQHNGLQWVQETVPMQTVSMGSGSGGTTAYNIKSNFKYKFNLKPVYEIANVRKNSSAAKAGLREGDIIITIDNVTTHRYSLQDVNAFFRSENEKWITLEIERESQILKFAFKLDDIL
ncbi:PDZ domain (Also known as DHR or GLGF) [Flavobacterium micromati]|uniref:PDZ domain (Also known as DHR or GLGF) n=1 Tax=Flavobacterium micromati TaxID=229205 RepID=A0A1M5P6H6_9FLAO|nr:aspartyl protease family protein [Flavobacterium micromati]SHG97287.1 PDZ domain (Also known as DHR or GLGF) [Flavobacterium micromati]